MSNNEGPQERGILTEADREYLRNPDGYSRQAAYNRNEKIRERLRRSLGDFPLLATTVDDSVLDDLLEPSLVWDELPDGTRVGGRSIASEAITLPYVITFLLRAHFATQSSDRPALPGGAHLSSFANEVENGIQIWLNTHYDLTADVDVAISLENLQRPDAIAEELRDRDEPLTGYDRIETVSRLSRAGYSTEEIAELVGEQPDEATDDVDESGSDTA